MPNLSTKDLANLEKVIGENYKKWSTHSITNTTKVLLSFGSRSGGIQYVFSLREQIMQKAQITDKYEVYIDAKSNIEHPSTYFETRHGTTIPLNPLWQELYMNAVKHCKCMIFVVTEEWAKSNWCINEFIWWRNLAHKSAERTPIITLIFQDAVSLLGNTTIVAHGTSKVSGRNRLKIVDKNSHPIAPTDCTPEVDWIMEQLKELNIY